MFDDAWDAAPLGGDTLRNELRKREAKLSGQMEAGGAYRSSSNGHSGEAFLPGSNSATMAELRRGWRRLVDLFDRTKYFLTVCNAYGLDPLAVEESFPSSPGTAVQNPTPVTDNDVAEWIMGTMWAVAQGIATSRLWACHLMPVYESRSDYSWLRMAGYSQFA